MRVTAWPVQRLLRDLLSVMVALVPSVVPVQSSLALPLLRLPRLSLGQLPPLFRSVPPDQNWRRVTQALSVLAPVQVAALVRVAASAN